MLCILCIAGVVGIKLACYPTDIAACNVRRIISQNTYENAKNKRLSNYHYVELSKLLTKMKVEGELVLIWGEMKRSDNSVREREVDGEDEREKKERRKIIQKIKRR